MLRLRVIDLETTGMGPPAEIIEIGLADVEFGDDGATVSAPSGRLFRPIGPIPPETMAVHHLTQADIPADAPHCTLRNYGQLFGKIPDRMSSSPTIASLSEDSSPMR